MQCELVLPDEYNAPSSRVPHLYCPPSLACVALTPSSASIGSSNARLSDERLPGPPTPLEPAHWGPALGTASAGMRAADQSTLAGLSPRLETLPRRAFPYCSARKRTCEATTAVFCILSSLAVFPLHTLTLYYLPLSLQSVIPVAALFQQQSVIPPPRLYCWPSRHRTTRAAGRRCLPSVERIALQVLVPKRPPLLTRLAYPPHQREGATAR